MVTLINEVEVPEKRRIIRYLDDEEAVQPQNELSRLSRRASVASSMSSDRVRRRSIDPALALPIEYRTLYVHTSLFSMPSLTIAGPFTSETPRKGRPGAQRTWPLLVRIYSYQNLMDTKLILSRTRRTGLAYHYTRYRL